MFILLIINFLCIFNGFSLDSVSIQEHFHTLYPTLQKQILSTGAQTMNTTNKKSIMITTLTTMIIAMPFAQANHEHTSINTVDYTPSIETEFTVKAKVVKVTPIFKYVTINTPVQNCYKERVTHTSYNDGNRGGRMLLGGLIGGAIGNNIGHGKSRKVRAAVGALIGSHIGSSIADQHAYSTQHTGYERRCETQHVSETKKQIEGYNVSYRFRGQVMTTQMPYHPGRRIKLNVSVSPVID